MKWGNVSLKAKVRPARIESAKPHSGEDENAHLWAVSYSDFLMVLLSFFIIFFSTDEDKKKSIVEEIVLLTQSEGRSSTDGPGEAAERSPANLPKKIEASLKEDQQIQVEGEFKERTLIVHFPQNIYEKGSVVLKPIFQEQLVGFLRKLQPFEKEIELVFVGHTDDTPLRSLKSRGLYDNYDLSALRASTALRLGLKAGLPGRQLLIAGSAENIRNTRSLSVQVLPRRQP